MPSVDRDGKRFASLGPDTRRGRFALCADLQVDLVLASLRCHGAVARSADQYANDKFPGQLAPGPWCCFLQLHDALLEWMNRLPVTVNQVRLRRQLRLEHGFAVAAPLLGVAAHDGRIAGQFLVEPEAPGAQMDQWMEPEHALKHRAYGVN